VSTFQIGWIPTTNNQPPFFFSSEAQPIQSSQAKIEATLFQLYFCISKKKKEKLLV
jgi:hypothetical protein